MVYVYVCVNGYVYVYGYVCMCMCMYVYGLGYSNPNTFSKEYLRGEGDILRHLSMLKYKVIFDVVSYVNFFKLN